MFNLARKWIKVSGVKLFFSLDTTVDLLRAGSRLYKHQRIQLWCHVLLFKIADRLKYEMVYLKCNASNQHFSVPELKRLYFKTSLCCSDVLFNSRSVVCVDNKISHNRCIYIIKSRMLFFSASLLTSSLFVCLTGIVFFKIHTRFMYLLLVYTHKKAVLKEISFLFFCVQFAFIMENCKTSPQIKVTFSVAAAARLHTISC